MIVMIISLALAFLWLGYESDWMRVRLMVGDLPKREFEPMLCHHSRSRNIYNEGYCGEFKTYKLPARTIKMYGSTLNLYQGCNRCRAKLLRAIYKAHKSKATAHYPTSPSSGYAWQYSDFEPSIEIKVDGKVKASLNGDFKRGMIKQAMKA